MMSNRDKIILDLCGGTGAWSKPYKDAGYDVRVVTIPEYDVRLFPSTTSDEPRYPRHFIDIKSIIGDVQGVLAAPPCTVFAGSGATWVRSDDDILMGLSVVDACLRIVYATKPAWWVMENPVGKLRKWIGAPVMTFHPCDYGDPYRKRTLLWGDFNTDLKKTPVIPVIPSPIHMLPPSEDRAMLRSITPPGFAIAFFEANP